MMSFVGMESNFNIYIENKFVANNEIIKWKHSQSEYLYFCYFLKFVILSTFQSSMDQTIYLEYLHFAHAICVKTISTKPCQSMEIFA